MNATTQDYYEILGVSRDASKEQIDRAYRTLARRYHPDVNSAPDAAEKFKRITEAYEVLKDPEKRRRYDQFGTGWQQFAGGRQTGSASSGFPGFEHFEFRFGDGQEGGFEDLFETFFAEREGLGRRASPFGTTRRRRGADHEAEIEVTLEEAARGTTKTIELERLEGNGSRPSRRRVSYTVAIPPGVTEGSRIRLANQGGQGSGGGESGDLYLRVRLRPDPRFEVQGHDLRTTLDVAPWEAALGAQVEVPTLDGTARMKVPPGTQSGQVLRLRGKGLPKRHGPPGDLLVALRIVVPKTLTPRERELFEQLARESVFRPRGTGGSKGW